MALIDLVFSRVKDEASKLNYPDDYLNAIAAALTRYSKHRQLELVVDIEGNGGNDYDLPENWQQGLSSVISLEFPAGLIPEVILDKRDYRLYRSPQGAKLRILNIIPTATEVIRLTYNGLHTEETVPVADQDAVVNLAASICCTQLASAYGQSSDPTIQADVVNYRDKVDSYRRLAEFLEGQYKEQLGIKPQDTSPAASAAVSATENRRFRLTHGRR